MFMVVVGCGRVGAELAVRLYRRGHQVAIIDQLGASFDHLPSDYRGRTIEAEVLSEGVMAKAGVGEANGLAAVTNSDPVNAVVGHVARTVFNVPSVVVRNYAPRWLALHEAFGLQAVSSTAWGAQRIEELLHQPMGRSVFSAGNGEVEVYEVAVPAAWEGQRLADLLAPGDCVPVSLTRGGRATIPGPDHAVLQGDVLHVSATLAGIEALRKQASPKLEGR
jgi:trk system potassium uptake protein